MSTSAKDGRGWEDRGSYTGQSWVEGYGRGFAKEEQNSKEVSSQVRCIWQNTPNLWTGCTDLTIFS